MKVLIAIDEDSCKNAIVKFVCAREWPAQTEFLILHIVPPKTNPRSDDIFMDDQKAAARLVRRVGLALRDAYHTPHIEEKVVTGSPKEKIEEIAREWGSDLTVVGSQGKFADYLFGSVAESTITNSNCSVLVIKPQSSTIQIHNKA